MAKKKNGNRTKGTGSLQREKSGIYTIRAMINGKRFSKSTKTTDRAEAEKILAQFMKPFVKNDDAQTYRNLEAFVASAEQKAEMEEDKRPQLRLDEAWEAYKASPKRGDQAAATLENKEKIWGAWVKWLNLNHPEIQEVRHVTVEMVEEYLAYLRVDHAASTYNGRLCALREMTRVIMKKARQKENPWEDMKQLSDDSCRRRELTVEELERLITQARRSGDEWLTLFCFGMYTGQRLGDCCTFEWKEIDLVRSIIQHIPSKTKRYAHGKPVTIPIHPILADRLCQTPKSERTGYVLPTLAAWYRMSRPKVSYKLKCIFEAAGIVTSVAVEGRKWKVPEATFHSLRHTFVSMSANAGVPLHIVQSIVGHESTAMTRHYFHESEGALRKAVAAIPTIGGTAVSSGDRFFNGNGPLMAQGVEFFPEESVGSLPAPEAPEAAFAPVPAPVQRPALPPVAPRGEEMPIAPMEPEVLPPAPKVEIPSDAKVEIREFGRVYVNGVATGGRIGGATAKKLPPKAAWMGEAIRIWSSFRHLGILEGTMDLVENGGHKFLQQLYDRKTIDDPAEAVEITKQYLKSRGIELY